MEGPGRRLAGEEALSGLIERVGMAREGVQELHPRKTTGVVLTEAHYGELLGKEVLVAHLKGGHVRLIQTRVHHPGHIAQDPDGAPTIGHRLEEPVLEEAIGLLH